MNRPDKLFVLGLTGPTGAGKSAVAGMLAAAGLPVLEKFDRVKQKYGLME